MPEYKDKPLDSDKYSKMGVTPNELYLRQTGRCWLTFIYDDHGDGEKVLGGLYCTDGKEYAETCNMLNPTFECVKCFANFAIKEKNEKRDK